jgi:NADH-quinone oxidoreductase subunit G
VASAEADEVPAAEREEPGEVAPARPSLLRFTRRSAPPVPDVDSYSLRLVSSRKLYDEGTRVQQSVSLRALAPGATLRLNPAELGRLGLGDGASVRVTSRKGSAVVPATADAGVPRGSAVVWFNQPGLDAASLVDADAVVTAVRIETVDGGGGA